MAQPLTIAAGSPTDSSFVGGSAYIDNTLGAAPFNAMRFGPSFSYRIPSAPGLYRVRISFIEPNKTAGNQRLFTVKVGGVTSDLIDLYTVSGRREYSIETTALATFGNIDIQFTGVLGNAVVSLIEVWTIFAAASCVPEAGTLCSAASTWNCPIAWCSRPGYAYSAIYLDRAVCVRRCVGP